MSRLVRDLICIGLGSLVVVVLSLLAISSGKTVGRSAYAAGVKGSFESLLKEAKIDYTKTSDGGLKIIVSDGEESALVYGGELPLDAKGEEKLAYFYCLAVDVPDGVKPSAAMLKKVAEINDRLLIGKLGLSPESGDIWYISSLYLSTASVDNLMCELALALYSVPDLRKELKPFLTAE